MPISEEELKKIVAEVVRNLSPQAEAASSGGPVFDTVDEAVNAAEAAQPVFQDLGLEAREKIIAAMRETSRANARRWAEAWTCRTCSIFVSKNCSRFFRRPTAVWCCSTGRTARFPHC